jgi:hypothetical protein
VQEGQVTIATVLVDEGEHTLAIHEPSHSIGSLTSAAATMTNTSNGIGRWRCERRFCRSMAL